MRKIVVFTMILTFIFAMAGCTAHSEPDEKAAKSLSSNAVIEILTNSALRNYCLWVKAT